MKCLNRRILFSLGLAALLRLPSAPAALHEVNITNFAFVPASLTIPVGDSVRWVNRDAASHTSTSGTGGTPDGHWNSGSLSQNRAYTNTFTSAGAFPYYCVPHPFMTASITVQVASNVPPTVTVTSPTNETVFSNGLNLVIEATATDSDGTVASVEFYDGTNVMGVDLDFPYSVTVNLTPGEHTLTAQATDDDGAETISAPVNVRVQSVPIDDPIVERIPKGDLTIELTTIADGMLSPLSMAVPDDGTGRTFVYDQAGFIWLVTAAGRSATPVLDVRERLVPLGSYDERGLLGLALHTNFAQNPLLYTYTSEPNNGMADFMVMMTPPATNNHQSVIAEWRLDAANTNRVDPASRREILRIDKPQSNHNGGTMRFGPDGLLYISLGDGGAADDQGAGHLPAGNAQSLDVVLGKVLRIDVDGTNSANGRYGVPASNPFVDTNGVDEIFAYGLRNPFSFSFDRSNGDLYLADVGQNKVEEVDIITRGGNFGWNVKEGTFFFDPNGSEPGHVTATPVRPVPPDLIDPIAQYDHDDGFAAVGGYVYRGSQIPELSGRYLFGDWGSFGAPSGRLFYLTSSNTVAEFRIGLDDRPLGLWLKGFGQDAQGELYAFGSRMLGPQGISGRMVKIVAAPAAPVEFDSVARAAGTNVHETWTGGRGPFALQKKESVTDAFWQNVAFSTNREAVVTNASSAGFFRIADVANQPAIPLSCYLTGEAERPNPLTNAATGLGLFSLDGNSLRFHLRYSGLSGPATAAHIHGPAAAAGSADVLISLAPFTVGSFSSNGTVSGVVVLTDAQKAMVLAGQTYVNFHTAANPGGEVRGQIAPILMQTVLSGGRERPDPVNTPGFGVGALTLVGNELSFNITYRGLKAPATAAHIHGPASASASAGVMIGLNPFNGGGFGSNGTLTGTTTLTPSQLAFVIDGLTYVNLHTPPHSGGEIRGQIWPHATGVPLTTLLNGQFEQPTALTNSATGSGIFNLEGDVLSFSINYRGMSGPATGAHLHGPATTSQSTGVVVNLAPFNGGAFDTNGTLAGAVVLTPQQRGWLLNGQMYVNVHTAANPGGETRGQIAAVLMHATLAGINERPTPVVSPAMGAGLFALVWDRLGMAVAYSGLTGGATAAHIHGPASTTQSADVLIDLGSYHGGAFGTSGSLVGMVPVPLGTLPPVIDGRTYVNIHTPSFSAGEIRGQIVR